MFIASQSGHLEVFCLFSDAGADKEIAMQGGATPLLVASQSGHLEVICLLLCCRGKQGHRNAGWRHPFIVRRISAGASRGGPSPLMQGPTRTSQCMVVPPPCSSHPSRGARRWFVGFLKQGLTRTSHCRMPPPCSSHLRMDTSSFSATSKPGRLSPSPGGTALAESFIIRAPLLLHRYCYTDPISTLQQLAARIGVSAREVLCHSSRKRRNAVVIVFLLRSVFGSCHTPHCAFRLSPVISELWYGALLCEVSTLGMTCWH